MKFKFTLLAAFFYIFTVTAQEKKTVEAKYIREPIIIDAVLDDSVYQNAIPAKDFVQLQPYNGKPSFQPSEAYFFYDQTAIYVGAMLYDSAPDSIFNYLSERDDIGMSDYFGVYIDPYNQGQLAYGFFVTPAGVQTDLKAVKSDGDNEDGNWNAVWQSKTSVTGKGWIVELRIPYSALRFSEKAGQTWGLNMFRNIRRYNSNNSWSLVDRKISGFIHQEGQMTGIKNIKPPVRLSFSPYAATYIESGSGKLGTNFIYKGGMDLKYGLNESFTLDMMLIPDFGQIQSDDKELNLSPYELYYDEKRQFFTEGTELFQRGNVFYSRRIGASPKFKNRAEDALNTGEIVASNPNETQLVNATKISGRSSGGWGLGFLNAMSLPSYSTVRDTLSGTERKVLTQPFTNYNVSVVDKSIKNNGYISLINSNISMFNDPFRANVTATEFQIRDKSKKFAIKGKGGISTRGETKYETGYFASLALEKNKGNFKFGILQNIYDDKYNPNDLGYLRRNNEMLTESWIYYQIIEPFWIIREWQSNIWWDHFRVVNPSKLFCNNYGIYSYILFKNNYYFEMNGGLESDKNNYYEARVKNRFLFEPYYYWINLWLGTDSRKPVRIFIHYGGNIKPDNDEYANWGNVSLNVRVGQHLQFSYNSGYQFEMNDRGYLKNVEETHIFFARRDVRTIENVFEAAYAINNKAGLRFRSRHYWSGAFNKNFYSLDKEGLLKPTPWFAGENENYNSFNIDMIFRWIFAPGSELSLAWKNSIIDDNDLFIKNYWDNIDKTWHTEQINSISLKILYYIDYNNIRRKKK